jgi:RecB family exonuclease
VVAPASLARGFDAWGRLSTAFWRDRNVPLASEHWHTAEKPVDQADCLARVVASWKGRFAPHELSIGLGDEQVAPYLERRLGAGGVRLTNAAGRPIEHTRPYRLLRAVARYLERGAFADLAALVRDPDLGRDLLEQADAVHVLDRYQGRHLPVMADQELAPDPECKPAVEALRRRLYERLSELRAHSPSGPSGPRALSEWAARLRAFLADTYGKRELDRADAADRLLAQALEGLGQALGEMESAPGPLGAAAHPASAAIEILLRRARGTRLPERVAESAEATIEQLGWLELPLDEAPALIVTGFNEGRIPASVHGHPFLPDGARKRLGLPHDEDRVARDVYACTVLLSTRRAAVFIGGRRTLEGDPLAPSRLAFHVPEGEISERVRRFLPDEEARVEAAVISEGSGRAVVRPVLPPDGARDAHESMSVSSFRTYLESPYGYYLRHVLRIDTLDDRARELDPRLFGILAHEVLQAFGESDLAHSDQAEAIARFLEAEVERELELRCGPAPQPAVRLQAEQLKYRLGLFAARQAQHRRWGWRIEHVEWRPPGGSVDIEVDGTPVAIRGQIDRIDLHPERGWAIIDYKTSEQTRNPEDAHRRMGRWVDLQLPLYRLLTRPLGMDTAPRLGYGNLGKDEKHIAFAFADGWNEDDLEEAYGCARDVVRAVRRGEFGVPDRRPPYEPILRALHGVGLIDDEVGAGEAE